MCQCSYGLDLAATFVLQSSAFLEFAIGSLGLNSVVTQPEAPELKKSWGSQRIRNVAGLRKFQLGYYYVGHGPRACYHCGGTDDGYRGEMVPTPIHAGA